MSFSSLSHRTVLSLFLATAIAGSVYAQAEAPPAPAPIPLPTPPAASAPALPPGGAAAPGTPPVAGIPLPPASAKPPAATAPESEEEEPARIRSMMFKPEIIERLDQAIANIAVAEKESSPASKLDDDLLNQLLAAQPKDTAVAAPIPKAFPVFYLGSIIYASPNEWSIWLNNVRFTNWNNKPDRNFYVVSLDKTRVTMRWKPVPIILPDLKSAWAEGKDANNPHYPHQLVSVDDAAATVTFTLHPNQSFIAKAMQIREGHYVNSDPPPSVVIPTMPGSDTMGRSAEGLPPGSPGGPPGTPWGGRAPGTPGGPPLNAGPGNRHNPGEDHNPAGIPSRTP